MLLNSELERQFVKGASVFELAKSDNSEICSASKLTVGTCNILIQIFLSCYLKGSDVFLTLWCRRQPSPPWQLHITPSPHCQDIGDPKDPILHQS